LILFSGLGADHRLFSQLKVGDIELITPDHLAPLPDEDLVAFARRCAQAVAITRHDLVGGASFGGMIAAEIARQQTVAGLVLLGTCIQPRKLPMSYRMTKPFVRWIPSSLLKVRRVPFLIRWRFAPLTKEAFACLLLMGSTFSGETIKAFCRMVLGWTGVESFSCPVLSLHGDRDRMIPVSCAIPASVVIPNAGHAFTLTHPETTTAAIRPFLSTIT